MQVNQVEFIKNGVSSRSLVISVIGMGYVGLPLSLLFAQKGFVTLGIDIDEEKINFLSQGQSYIRHISSSIIQQSVSSGLLKPTSQMSDISKADIIILCVPTPLTLHREPDMSYIMGTMESVLSSLKQGQLLVLESTTYPKTMQDLIVPFLQEKRKDLVIGQNFYLAYSPEREDPGNPFFDTQSIPKVIGADDALSLEFAKAVYEQIVTSVVPVSGTAVAEAVKITENIFRCVNIALVNELKVIFDKMDIDVWEVIEAAKTKPFGYMPFYPGPGLGGHCIPIDPFYLTWKAREFGVATRFIELAGQINNNMIDYVIEKTSFALDQEKGKGLKGSKILLMGIAYKKNIGDMRESPSLVIMEKLLSRGAFVDFFDPYIPMIPPNREHTSLVNHKSVDFNQIDLEVYDLALICTDHDDVNYDTLFEKCSLILDTRNVSARYPQFKSKTIKA